MKNEARALHLNGNLVEAVKKYESILTYYPKDSFVLHQLGSIANLAGNYELARDFFTQAIHANPRSTQSLYELGLVQKHLGLHSEALKSLDLAIKLKPDFSEAINIKGRILYETRHFDDSLIFFNRALKIKPGFVDALNNRGTTYHELKKYNEAIRDYNLAIETSGGLATVLNNRGISYQSLGRSEDALSDFIRATELDPKLSQPYNNIGNIYYEQKRFDDAIEHYIKSTEIDPNYVDAYFNLAVCFLLIGDFESGWKNYEWRWKKNDPNFIDRNFTRPLLNIDNDLTNKTVLLHAEQGLGDTIQFCRYAALVKELGARVVLEVQPALKSLLADIKGVDCIVSKGEPLPSFEYHCPLLSLPFVFSTNMDTVPRDRSYISAKPEKVSTWDSKLGMPNSKRVGLVWSGSQTHLNDMNRSIKLEQYRELLNAGAMFVSLQKELRDDDRVTLLQMPDVRFFGNELVDFTDTAALVENMDLVITVDTSVAHLSAAMGKPTWILLPELPDWRWLNDRQDSLWYPCVRLFRQSHKGDWNDVMENLKVALNEWLGDSSGR